MQSALIRDADLERKYHNEFHANEIVLLAYYIAAIHIEEAFHGRRGPESFYEPFDGIVLTDTFNLHTDRTGFPKEWLPDNSERAERQQNAPIQVIVSNPPWRAGQRSASDDNPNVDYPDIEERVAKTYAARSRSTNKNSLYDTYKMAIRWASDRVGDQGVVAFVTNGSWIDGNVDSGVRACLAEEFSSVHVLNLRGHTWKGGERGRAEGGPVFGQGSSATVAIVILTRNPNAKSKECNILYRDIGDYMKREKKLSILDEVGSIAGIADWQKIKPDQHHDWIGQRDAAFQDFYPMGSQAAKAGDVGSKAIFKLYSNGYYTGRDTYIYNFSRNECAINARGMVDDYRAALRVLEKSPSYNVNQVANVHSSRVRWDQTLKNRLSAKVQTTFDTAKLRRTAYRPFVAMNCYADQVFAKRPGPSNWMFPANEKDNKAICVPGVGSTKPFSALVVNVMPDLHFVSFGQCFPRFRYESRSSDDLIYKNPTLDRIDNISNSALDKFRSRYRDKSITKDAIFDYVYGILHQSSYRSRFTNDLAKDLPRIPFAPEFRSFAEAGSALTELHLNYETCEEYSLDIVFSQPRELQAQQFRLGERAMKFEDDEKTVLRVNEHVSLRGIPEEAHRYQVNGRTPLEWFIDRYRIKRDKRSGIVNDPNEWFDDPRDLVAAIRRIVHVSVETVRIVEALPEAFEHGDEQH